MIATLYAINKLIQLRSVSIQYNLNVLFHSVSVESILAVTGRITDR